MSALDKDKQKEEEEKQKRKAKKERQKHTEEENLDKINLQQNEKIRLNYVFNKLCELEAEKSSDDDSKAKKYIRDINDKAKKKQMKIPKSKFKSKLETLNKKNYKNKDEEEEMKEKQPPKKKFSQKALRKIIRKLCHEFAKDELDNMIWEVDENLDGYVSEKEFENMYKKCITDENEEEGKCKIGQEIQICIKIIEGKSSYGSCSKNGISSSSYGYWDGSYIFC